MCAAVPKKLKTNEQQLRDKFSEFLRQDPGDLNGAIRVLLQLAEPCIGSMVQDDPKSYRVPAKQLSGTWHRDVMRHELVGKKEAIRERMKTYARNDRQPVVIGIRLGSGFGKTHVLTEAPDLLSAKKGIYVTYNLEQNLAVDREMPEKSLLIRMILALISSKPLQSALFLMKNRAMLSDVTVDALRNLFVFYASMLAGGGDIVIGVDELMELGIDGAKFVVSDLAQTAAQYWEQEHSMCTVLVSSLATEVFERKNGRIVDEWVPSRPNQDTLVYFAASLPEDMREKAMALVNAVSGRHMRSIVVAFEFVGQKMACSVQFLFDQMKKGMGNKVKIEELTLIREHVRLSITSKREEVWRGIEGVTDKTHAVPPVFLKMAFEEEDTQTKHCLDKLLHSFSLFDKAGGHLENASKWFDLFRASLGLPVVPARASVYPGNGTGVRATETSQWYYDLEFSEKMSLSEDALLKQTQVREGTKTRSITVATGIVPQLQYYYHPKISNHPWIDRAYVAIHPTKTLCLVLVQDKVNASDFANACDKLNKAADSLTELSKDLTRALLIVNVIGASEGTHAQSSLNWPHILIRGQEEVRQFYSVNFADMVWFARERHVLAN